LNVHGSNGKTDKLFGFLPKKFAESSWISKLNQEFQDDPAHLVVIDDALEPSRYRLLSQALRNDCDWETRHGVIRHRTEVRPATEGPTEWVEATEFVNAAPAEQFFQHAAFLRARPGREMTPGMIELVRFKSLLTSPPFLDMLGRITGSRPQGLQEMLIRRMVRGDLAKPHDDAIGGRTFCLLLYLSDGWQPEFDGRFIMHMPDGDRSIDPLPNRMLLFNVNTGIEHSVSPLGESAADWHRYNFSIWFR
jgi:hypothetical protein